LDAAYWRIGGILTVYPSETFTVILYTLQQFRDVTRAPAWAGGMYDGQIRVAVRGAFDQPSEFERVLTHEFVHAVVAMLGGHNVPWWINEGLATALEPQGIEWAGSVLDSTSARLPLSRLHDSVQRFTGNDVSIAYAESTVAVHRMLNLQGPFAFVALLRDIYGGTPFESAFHHRMSLPYEDFQRLIAQR
jgi:hypothetical protein